MPDRFYLGLASTYSFLASKSFDSNWAKQARFRGGNRAMPCQGIGRGFESRLPLHLTYCNNKENGDFNLVNTHPPDKKHSHLRIILSDSPKASRKPTPLAKAIQNAKAVLEIARIIQGKTYTAEDVWEIASYGEDYKVLHQET